MKRAFADYPEVDCIGGRIRPRWTTPAPSWMRLAHAGPLALQDRPHPVRLDRTSASVCLLGANLACRRRVFSEVGGFSSRYPRNQDREFELRVWQAGKRGLYLPAMDVIVEVPADRLTKAYHRRWQATTGSYHAVMRFRDTLDASGQIVPESMVRRRWLGTPLFLYRECLHHVAGWWKALFAGDADDRFFHETRLCYFKGFLRTRIRTDVVSRFRIGSRRSGGRRLPRSQRVNGLERRDPRASHAGRAPPQMGASRARLCMRPPRKPAWVRSPLPAIADPPARRRP